MKPTATIAFLFTTISIAYSQIGAKPKEDIYGTWVNKEFGYEMILKLDMNGTGMFDGESIKFKTENNQLTIDDKGDVNTYSYIINGNSMTVSGGDLDAPITMLRQNAGLSSTPAIKSSPNSLNQLIGRWSNYGETWEFKANNQCAYLGKIYPYAIAANTLVVQTPEGNLTMNFAINGNELKLTLNGNEFVYMKNAAAQSPVSKTSTGKRSIDQSLVGKWCYINVTSTNSGGSGTDQCITINADGTYSYYSERSMSVNTPGLAGGTASQNSDSGTWWVEGDRVFYISQTQGQGSYKLQKINHPKNNDPMIVLDGIAYVTAYQKSPW